MTIVVFEFVVIFFFKQMTAYEMRISDWSSDVCSLPIFAGAGDGRGEVGQPLLGAERDDGLALRVQLDAEAARVVGAERAAQAGDAARGRVAVRARIGQGLRQLVDDVLRRRLVGIAHAEVDYVLAGGARLGLQGVDLGKIGRAHV